MTFVPPLQAWMQALRAAGKLDHNTALSDDDAAAITTEEAALEPKYLHHSTALVTSMA